MTDRLLAPQVSDVDGNTEERRGTVSVFNGPPPAIRTFENSEAENAAVGAWLSGGGKADLLPNELAGVIGGMIEQGFGAMKKMLER